MHRRVAFLLLAATSAVAAEPARLLVPPAQIPAPVPVLTPLLPGMDNVTVGRWETRRRELAEAWRQVLGPWPAEKVPLQPEILATEELAGFTRQHVRYQVEAGVWTDGYLLTPHGLTRRVPAVVVFHQTTKTQAQQVAGIDASNPELMHGLQLVQRGYVVFCPRCFIFAEGNDYAGHVTAMQRTHPARTGMARMTWDAIRAMDFILTQPNVDPDRVGGLGHSLGAKEVLYAAAFDPRYRAVVFSEGGIGLGFSNWEAPWYLGPQVKRPGFPRDHHELIALIAPRAFLLLAGDSADSDRSWSYISATRPIYQAYGREDRLGWLNHHSGHRYPPLAQSTAEAFLDAQLRR